MACKLAAWRRRCSVFGGTDQDQKRVLAEGVVRCRFPYFYAWSRSDVLDHMMEALRGLTRVCDSRSAPPTAAIIDSQSASITESGDTMPARRSMAASGI